MISNRLKGITSLFLVLVLGFIVIGCTNHENGSDSNIPEDEETIEQEITTEDESAMENSQILVEDLVADLTYRFMRVIDVDYTEPLLDLPRDYGLTFELTPEATKKLWERFANDDGTILVSNFLRVYRDSALTQEVFFRVEGDGDRFLDSTTLTIGPPRNPDFTIYDPGAGGRLFDQGEYNDWGNAEQYFLVRDVDFTTGEPLERPLVTVFSIATEVVGAPRVEFHVNEDGGAGLVWDSVPGATEYAIVRVSECKYGRAPGRTSFLVERTTDTYWVDDLTGPEEINGNFSFLSSRATSNLDTFFDFVMNVSEREWTLEEFVEEYWKGLCFEPERHAELEWYFGVIALNSEGTSSISNLIDIRIVNSQVPVFVATHLNEGGVTPTGVGRDTSGTVYGEILQAPSHAWVIMGDGFPTQYLINYQPHLAYVEDSVEASVLMIPYHIEGTSFEGVVHVIGYNEETFEEELQELVERQDALRVRTGGLQHHINLNPLEDDLEDSGGDREHLESDDEEIRNQVATELRDDFEVYASSRLSAFLAIQMLNGQERVNLDGFPEASNHEYLVEAWFEAVLQNPLILGARGMQLCSRSGDLLIAFDQDSETRGRQQDAIMERVDEIVEEIITPDMDDLEIQITINYFLIEFATYDYDALDNAALNNFTHVDPEYYDSFTAYGILINGVGVCSGYADAFNLLATRAGLESVIVTGYLQGSLPHAWNRVYIEGQWYTLDVTNNDNEFFPNAFFNLSDREASSILTEDGQWMLNRELPRFVATSETFVEYYRYHERFFDLDEVAQTLIEGINVHGRATYRTAMLLTEERFQEILQVVIRETGNPDLVGGHFMGVITVMEN